MFVRHREFKIMKLEVIALFLKLRLSVDNLTGEVVGLKNKLKSLEKDMKSGPKDICTQFSEFIEVRLFGFLLCSLPRFFLDVENSFLTECC